MITRQQDRMPVTVTGIIELVDDKRVFVRSDNGMAEWIDTDDVHVVTVIDDQLPFPTTKEQ